MADLEFDIMISYSSKQSLIADRLEAKLHAAKFKVWRDKNEIHKFDSVYAAMAFGIAHSKIILLLLSSSYEESKFCEAEYEHEKKLGKLFIPIKVENYNPPPDSALSIIIGNALYYSLYDEKTFDQNLENLIKNIKEKLNKENEKKAITVKQEILPPETPEPIKISTEVLDHIANLLANDWKRNARFLNIAEHEIDQIDSDYRDTYEKCMRSFTLWTRKNNNITWGLLKQKSLLKIPRYDIIGDVEKNYSDTVDGPQKPTTIHAPDNFDSYSNHETVYANESKQQQLSNKSKVTQDSNEAVESEGECSSLNNCSNLEKKFVDLSTALEN